MCSWGLAVGGVLESGRWGGYSWGPQEGGVYEGGPTCGDPQRVRGYMCACVACVCVCSLCVWAGGPCSHPGCRDTVHLCLYFFFANRFISIIFLDSIYVLIYICFSLFDFLPWCSSG